MPLSLFNEAALLVGLWAQIYPIECLMWVNFHRAPEQLPASGAGGVAEEYPTGYECPLFGCQLPN